jgi:hypothetical protein
MGSSTLLNRFLLAVMVVELLLLVADVPEKAEAMDKK